MATWRSVWLHQEHASPRLQGLMAPGVQSQCQVISEAQLHLTELQLAQPQRAYSETWRTDNCLPALTSNNPGQRALNMPSSTDPGVATDTED